MTLLHSFLISERNKFAAVWYALDFMLILMVVVDVLRPR